MENEITEDNFNRLSAAIMTKYKCSNSEAMDKLLNFKLNLVCSEEIKESLPLQAALLTAVNSGKRAFLGGVTVVLPNDVDCLLPWPSGKKLNEIVLELSGNIDSVPNEDAFTITFGLPSKDDNTLQVICNSWQGGILVNGDNAIELPKSNQLPLAGIAAGALGIGLAFLKFSGISISACDSSKGISLWRPDLNWLHSDAQGPIIKDLPKKYWILGLGHLGQAYLWNIGLLKYKNSSDVSIVLQDFDKITEANYSAGLLCEHNNEKQFKTRVASKWLEERGFNTLITERKYNENTIRIEEEPFIALCGFDSASARLHLDNTGFDLIVEAGLGGNLNEFDSIHLHTFPNSFKLPKDIWATVESENEINSEVQKQFDHLEKNGCGIIAKTLASKAISSSFVGAFAGSLVIAELLRALNGGNRYDIISIHLRNMEFNEAVLNKKKNYDVELSRNGFVSI